MYREKESWKGNPKLLPFPFRRKLFFLRPHNTLKTMPKCRFPATIFVVYFLKKSLANI
jgi:hypothetical protein